MEIQKLGEDELVGFFLWSLEDIEKNCPEVFNYNFWLWRNLIIKGDIIIKGIGGKGILTNVRALNRKTKMNFSNPCKALKEKGLIEITVESKTNCIKVSKKIMERFSKHYG